MKTVPRILIIQGDCNAKVEQDEYTKLNIPQGIMPNLGYCGFYNLYNKFYITQYTPQAEAIKKHANI